MDETCLQQRRECDARETHESDTMPDWKTLARTVLSLDVQAPPALWRSTRPSTRSRGVRFMTILLFHRITDLTPEDGLTVGTKRFRRICRDAGVAKFRVDPAGRGLSRPPLGGADAGPDGGDHVRRLLLRQSRRRPRPRRIRAARDVLLADGVCRHRPDVPLGRGPGADAEPRLGRRARDWPAWGSRSARTRSATRTSGRSIGIRRAKSWRPPAPCWKSELGGPVRWFAYPFRGAERPPARVRAVDP